MRHDQTQDPFNSAREAEAKNAILKELIDIFRQRLPKFTFREDAFEDLVWLYFLNSGAWRADLPPDYFKGWGAAKPFYKVIMETNKKQLDAVRDWREAVGEEEWKWNMDIDQSLTRIIKAVEAMRDLIPQPPDQPPNRRGPKESIYIIFQYLSVGRSIRAIIQKSGLPSASLYSDAGPVAEIGALIVGKIWKTPITPAGFADRMRRLSKKDFSSHFPKAML